MSDDFAALIAAYRAENRGTALDAGAVRARVLEATGLRRRRRSRRAAWLLPIAAVLVGSGALAASAPARDVATRFFAAFAGVSVARVAPPPAQRARPSAPSATSVPIHPDALEPAAERPATSSSTSAARRAGPRVAKSVIAAVAAAATPTATATNEVPAVVVAPNSGPDSALDGALAADIASYRTAHELHFVHADYGRALAAWNAYLARFPHGTFAPEARLNRAVCLARLGHAEQALAVLGALAESEDAYTRAKALGLRAALAGASSPRDRD